jgi:hypothetical protein
MKRIIRYEWKEKLLAVSLWLSLGSLLFLSSCSSSNNFSIRYYTENKDELVSIRSRYDKIYEEKPFHIEFKDKSFTHISFEILTDTMRMIYNFDLRQSNLADTLDKYHYNTPGIIGLISDMQHIRVMWISKLDYYENREKKSLVFISIRHRQLESFMKGEKYYALAFFNERQTFDNKGRLTDRSEKKRMREINGQIFRRITDRVCYAITGNFR